MKLVSKLALAAALAAPCLVQAQDSMSSGSSNTSAAATTSEPVKYNTGALTFSGGVDFATAYYFRGYLQENSGAIIQPYFGVATTLVETDDFKIGLSVSTWNSLHSANKQGDADIPGDGNGADVWYENDIYVSLPVSFGKFTVTPSYYLYQYPNGAANTVHEALLTVAYDDTELWSGLGFKPYDSFALKPYATVAYEIDDGNGAENGYFEVGLAPTYTADISGYKLPLTFPVALGMGWDNYFVKSSGGNDFLGYLSVGVQTSVPIPETIIPAKYGSWAVTGGGYYMNLFSDSLEISNHDSSNVFWGKVGLTFSY